MPYPFLGLGFNSWSQKFSRGNVPAVVAAFLEYVTTSVSSFTLLSTGTVNYEVDWGDGTIETLTTNAPTHTYSSAGEYTIKITPAEGSTYYPRFNNNVSDTSIAEVSGTGGSQLGNNLDRAWLGASNMTSFGFIDTSSVTNLTNAWNGCSSLTSFPLIDTSNATNMNYTWAHCSGLTSFPLIDTSNVTNFYGSWVHCTGLTSFPQIDTSNGTDLRYAWQNNPSLTSFPLLNFAKATIFVQTWLGCSNLTTFPANMFDTTGTLTSDAFLRAFSSAALTPQSIENILVSLDINGQSNIILDIAGGNNAGYSTWTAAAQTALANLQAKGWTISYYA